MRPAKDQGFKAKVQTISSVTILQQFDERKKDEERSFRCSVSRWWQSLSKGQRSGSATFVVIP